MAYTIREIPDLRGFTVEWAEPGRNYLSRRNTIYRSPELSASTADTVARIAAPSWRSAASVFRLAQRLLRFQVTNIMPLDDELFVTFDRSVGIVREGKFSPLEGLVRPCRVLRSACGKDASGNVLFGEYLANDERGPMHVYRYAAGSGKLDIVHTFIPGTIKHVHGIYFDEFSGFFHCLTGDQPAECEIMRCDREFQNVKVLGRGDETWRAVSMLFTERAIYYGTDAEFRENQIFRLDRETGERVSLGDVSGTVFYSKQVGKDLFFTTTAENAPAQTENVAGLWHVDAEDQLTQIAKFAKDRWHPTLFQFGTIHLPNGPGYDDRLVFSLVGVEGDNRTYEAIRE